MRHKEDQKFVTVKCVDKLLWYFFAEYIFAAVLSLYMDEKAQSVPNSDEVLICSSETTSEEVHVFMSSPSQKYNWDSQYLYRSR